MKILLIDNNEENLESIKAALGLNGYDAEGFLDLDSAKKALNVMSFDVVITDYRLGDKTRGTDLFDFAGIGDGKVPIILLSGDPEIDLNRSIKNKVYKYFKKPIDIVLLLEELKKIESRQPRIFIN